MVPPRHRSCGAGARLPSRRRCTGGNSTGIAFAGPAAASCYPGSGPAESGGGDGQGEAAEERVEWVDSDEEEGEEEEEERGISVEWVEDGPLPGGREPATRSREGSRRRRSGGGCRATGGSRRREERRRRPRRFQGHGWSRPSDGRRRCRLAPAYEDAEEVEVVGERELTVVELELPQRDVARERRRLHQVFEYEVQVRSYSSLEL